MDKTLRSILWVLVALVILSSFSTGWFFVAKERLYNDYVNLENLFKASMERLNKEIAASKKENAELRKKLAEIEKELDILESKNKDLQYDYKGLSREKDDLEKEIVKVKNDKVLLEKKLDEMRSRKFVAGLLKENASLKVEVKKLQKSLGPRRDIEEKLEDAMEVAEILSEDLMREKEKVNRLTAQMKIKKPVELRAEAYHSPDEVELPPIVLQRDRPSQQAKLTSPSYSLERMGKSSSLRGRIVTVNRDHNFVVIDLGRQDGVDVGMRFDVYRGNNMIGSIEAIQARERIAAADIRIEKEGFFIETGDVIIER